jgi:hypothetical protein
MNLLRNRGSNADSASAEKLGRESITSLRCTEIMNFYRAEQGTSPLGYFNNPVIE